MKNGNNIKKGLLRTMYGDVKVEVRKLLKTKAIVVWYDKDNNEHVITLKYCQNIGYITTDNCGGIKDILFLVK